jgi:hypothetical protein
VASSDIMPKLIVLFCGAESPAVALAEAAADGAKRVRVTEVDLCAGSCELDVKGSERIGAVHLILDGDSQPQCANPSPSLAAVGSMLAACRPFSPRTRLRPPSG